MDKNKTIIRATTVVCVRDDKSVVIASDGQVTLGTSIIKSNANKIRTFNEDKIKEQILKRKNNIIKD